jgi:hypothetical protein
VLDGTDFRKNHGLREKHQLILRKCGQFIVTKKLFCLSTATVDKSVHGQLHSCPILAQQRRWQRIGEKIAT